MLVLFSMPGLIDTIVSVEDVSLEVSEHQDSILNTDISMISLLGGSGSNAISFTIANDGSEKLWKYEEFSTLVTYDADISGTKTRITEVLNFIQSDVIISDLAEPGIINKGESGLFSGTLTYPIFANGDLIVVFSNENGVTVGKATTVS